MSRSIARFLSGMVRSATGLMRPRRAEATRALVAETRCMWAT